MARKMRLKSLLSIQWIRRIRSYAEHLQLVGTPLSYILRLAVISASIIVILANVAALVILFTFDSESAQFISGGNPRQFHEELQVDLLDDYGEVLGIAHNSGNKIRSTIEALAYGADIIEIDVVLVQGQLHAAHWSPFRFIGDRLFRGPTLAEVWGAAAQADMIKLDLKDSSTEMVNKLVEFLDDRRRAKEKIIVVSEKPEILALMAQRTPKVIRMLSVSDEYVLLDLLEDEDLQAVIDGVSVNHSLLTVDIIASLKERGLIVFAWTVNDPARMNELVKYGVDGITTDNLAILDLFGAQRQIDITSRSLPLNFLS
ncbi:MAG: glycerophosphodiester phosphodiesterase [Dehalococcoidia bacterium]